MEPGTIVNVERPDLTDPKFKIARIDKKTYPEGKGRVISFLFSKLSEGYGLTKTDVVYPEHQRNKSENNRPI